jgi:putative endonuclease
MFHVYLLVCADNRTYVGWTDNLEDRLLRHNKGYVPATKDRLPIFLKAYFAFNNKETAFSFEKYLKTGSGRAFLNKHLF